MKIFEDKKSPKIDQILSLISEYANRKVDFNSAGLKLVDDLGFDSFSLVEITYELEIRLGVKISNDELKKIVTISDVIKIVESR